MRAIQVVGPSQLQVVELPDPPPVGDALVRVSRAGVCGTDVKVFKGEIAGPRPLVMGHEMVGTVVEPGSRGLLPAGTRVMIDPATTCGYCDLCRRGRGNLCRNGGLLGRDSDGVFSELVTVPEEKLHEIPDAVSESAASVLQVLGTCVHAQRFVNPFPTDTVAVVGLGVSGLLHIQLLAARGIVRLVGITRSPWKLDLATAFGAAITAAPEAAEEVLAEFSGRRGADLVVEAAGQEATLAQAISLVGPGGEVLVFGTLTGGDQGLPYYELYHKELTVFNPRAALPDDYDAGIALAAAGRLRLDDLVTHTFAVEDAEGAFEAVEESSSLKVVIDFTK
ncbi:MAG: alcohol dehydrogenase catalytic domain-containing protein [Acidimicrobiia bacterium]|nr:alcohol dehydrogenase catalytic domain-containing protein [Acidimicrobiia bacterium]